MTTFETLQGIFREVFDDSELVLCPEMTAQNIDGWDSLSNMILMMAIETRFRIKIPLDNQRQFHNVGAILSFISEIHSNSER